MIREMAFSAGRRGLCGLAAASFILCSSISNAAAQEPRLVRGPNETVRTEVPVSASGIIQGAMMGLPSGTPDTQAFILDYAQGWGNSLIFSVVGQDGRYEASSEYDVSDVPSGRYTVDTEFTKDSFVKETYRKGEVALLARLQGGPRARGRSFVVVPARWRSTRGSTDGLTLFVLANGERARVVYRNANGNTEAQSCRRATGRHKKLVYDTVCRLDLSKIPSTEDLRLQVFDSQRVFVDVTFSVALP